MLVYFGLPLAEGWDESSGFPEGDDVVQAVGDFPNGCFGDGGGGCHDWRCCLGLRREGGEGCCVIFFVCVWLLMWGLGGGKERKMVGGWKAGVLVSYSFILSVLDIFG